MTDGSLSYRDAVFSRAKKKNREELERRRASRRVRVLLGSKVTSIGETDIEIVDYCEASGIRLLRYTEAA